MDRNERKPKFSFLLFYPLDNFPRKTRTTINKNEENRSGRKSRLSLSLYLSLSRAFVSFEIRL